MPPSFPEEVFETAACNRFVVDTVARILEHEDLEDHIRWSLDEAPQRLAEAFASLDQDARRGAALALALQLWNVVPLPGHGCRPKRLAALPRNKPCPCGSGRKHKHCCQRHMPRLPTIHVVGFWNVIARRLPPERLARLAAAGALPPEATGIVARRFLEKGKPRRGVTLVERFFDEPESLGPGWEIALHALLDGCRALGWHTKTEKLLQDLGRDLRPPLRGVARARGAIEAIAHGDFDAAEAALDLARADVPGHVIVVSTECVLDIARGRFDTAAERARWWLGRLPESVEKDDSALTKLRAMADDPAGVGLGATTGPPEGLRRLRALLGQMSERPFIRYALVELDTGLRLEAPASLCQVSADWTALDDELFPEEKDPWKPAVADAWIDFLTRRPEAVDSLVILDDLRERILGLGGFQTVIDRVLLTPILRRAAQLVDAAFEDGWQPLAPAEPANEQALRLLGEHFDLMRRDEDPDLQRAIERLLALGASPETGPALVNALLRRGEDARVLELIGSAPDRRDPAMAYGRVLALYRLERHGEALAALADACAELPLVALFLVEDTPKMPKKGRWHTKPGEADRCWAYKADMGEVWAVEPGLVDWLGGMVRKLTRHRRV